MNIMSVCLNDINIICRICLQENANINIFQTQTELTTLSFHQIMEKLFSLNIKPGDGRPANVCRDCNNKILTAFELKLLAEKSENIFQEYLSSNKICNTLIEVENNKTHLSKYDCDNLEENISSIETQSKNQIEINICDLCGKHVKFIKQHKKCHSSEKTRIPCEQCNKIFSDQSACRRHIMIVHQGEYFFCEICRKHYKRGAQHMAIAHSKRSKNYECSLCHRMFYDKNQLNKHSTIHTAEKPYACSMCDRKFRIKSSLDSHRRGVHEKERKNICHYCSKGFFSAQNLQEHILIHTNDRKYKCIKCDNAYKSHSALRRHNLSHIGIKSEKCTVCNKGFYHKRALKVHMFCHSAVKNFTCRFCDTKFTRSDTRQRHERNSHGIGIKPG